MCCKPGRPALNACSDWRLSSPLHWQCAPPLRHPSRPELSQQEISPTMQQTSAALKPSAAPASPTALTAAITRAAGVMQSAEGGPGHRRAGAVLSRTALPALHPLAQRRGAPGAPRKGASRPCGAGTVASRSCTARSTGRVLFLPQWLAATVAVAAAARFTSGEASTQAAPTGGSFPAPTQTAPTGGPVPAPTPKKHAPAGGS